MMDKLELLLKQHNIDIDKQVIHISGERMKAFVNDVSKLLTKRVNSKDNCND